MKLSNTPWWRSYEYWIAMLLGPLFWITLWLSNVSQHQSEFVLKSFLFVALVYPILEEIVFRGGLQELLLSRTIFKSSLCGITAANLVTSVVFAAVHLFSQPPLWAATIFFPSLVFGCARDRFDSVLPAIALHVFYNTGFLLLFGSA